MEINPNCPLCNTVSETYHSSIFFSCPICLGIFKSKKLFPNPFDEKLRYEKHQYNPYVDGYLNFVSPITNAVLKNHNSEQIGLDFGSGSSSSISQFLRTKGIKICEYDPFFANNHSLLENKYDFIICCEVIEHFHHPAKEFQLLKQLLKPSGVIYLMTHLLDDSIDFTNWYYKNDFTHVFFYRKETINWIKKANNFKEFEISGRFIRLIN